MAVTNFLVTSLTDYVQTNHDLIVKNFALPNTGTRARIGIQTGIKKSALLNYLDLTPVIQDGSDCGFNPLDEIELSNREIAVAALKVDGQICPEKLIGKYAEYLVRINATENDLPFEQYIIDTLVAQLNKKIEQLIWQADSGGSDLFDGFLTQLAADSDAVEVTFTAVSAYGAILEVYAAMTEETLEKGGVIFVDPAIFRAFMQEMVANNFFHYAGPQNAYPEEFILPGSDAIVVKTYGLAGTKAIVGTFADNLVYGTDMEHDYEDVDLWWSNDDRLWKYQVKWASGVAYHFPEQIAYGVMDNAPVIPTPTATVLNAMAECVCSGE